MFKFEASCTSFIGCGRSNNEDNFYFNKKHMPLKNKGLKNPLKYKGDTEEPVLFAVFDGMGGEAKGEYAACCASEVFSKEYKLLDELALPGKEFFYKICEKANKEINDLVEENQGSTIGTTVAALYFNQDEVVSCNIGDSKVFLIRDNKMLQISEDHTDEKIMEAVGIHKKPVLLQYLGISESEMTIDPFISKGDIRTGDIYIICSDGITDAVPLNEIYDIATSYDSTQEIANQVVSKVKVYDGSDNSTIIVVRVI